MFYGKNDSIIANSCEIYDAICEICVEKWIIIFMRTDNNLIKSFRQNFSGISKDSDFHKQYAS